VKADRRGWMGCSETRGRKDIDQYLIAEQRAEGRTGDPDCPSPVHGAIHPSVMGDGASEQRDGKGVREEEYSQPNPRMIEMDRRTGSPLSAGPSCPNSFTLFRTRQGPTKAGMGARKRCGEETMTRAKGVGSTMV